MRTTHRAAVLPHYLDGEKLVREDRDRYAVKRVLGAGGMGEVVLAEDQDIGRNVALKFLHASATQDAGALARFVDEVRIVGSLEHPNIVPIHDVGVDENDRYYFVMKHVEGETLESIIEHLAAGDAQYHARYTFTARMEIFLALLRALEFAHEHGFVHRDIKPANVMVGHYGEVMLMDWGVAKRFGKAPAAPGGDAQAALAAEESAAAATLAPNVTVRDRLFTTRRGAIVGTPAYMSPEQARGDIDAIDERSDIYCASVLFHELVALHYYLGEPQNLAAMITAILTEQPKINFATTTHPTQGPPPAELLHIIEKGLQKDPAARYQNVRELIDLLEATLDGRVKVQCPATLTKRVTRELGRLVDRRPVLAMNLFLWGTLSIVAMMVWSVVAAVRLAH